MFKVKSTHISNYQGDKLQYLQSLYETQSANSLTHVVQQLFGKQHK